MVVFGISSRSSLYIQERCVSKQKETYDVLHGRGNLVHHQYVWSRLRRLRPLRFLLIENNVVEEFLFSFFPSLVFHSMSMYISWTNCLLIVSQARLDRIISNWYHSAAYTVITHDSGTLSTYNWEAAWNLRIPKSYIYIYIYIYNFSDELLLVKFSHLFSKIPLFHFLKTVDTLIWTRPFS